ncbi:MAG: hypothetical protein CMP59_00475 [Flavobacteriales bacterium]|nr:hypothetical protein [Flavobacteriales bacterium]|tara:strand:- start:1007 stop:1672 length:666 start_codon:yes stop_codon:yes gene_type:complete
MNYKEIRIYAHPRSGSNYFASIINQNFSRKENDRDIYGGHKLPGDMVKNNPSIAYLYIKRDFKSVLDSIFKMKERFGLLVKNKEELENCIYKDIYNPRLKSYIKFKNNDGSRVESKVSKFFANIEMSPKQYHELHIRKWEENEKYQNFYSVNYNDLMDDFDSTMKRIAVFLGHEIQEFKNIKGKVGYIPPSNGRYYLIMKFYNNYILKPAIIIYKKYLKQK